MIRARAGNGRRGGVGRLTALAAWFSAAREGIGGQVIAVDKSARRLALAQRPVNADTTTKVLISDTLDPGVQ